MSNPTGPSFKAFIIRPWHSATTKLHPNLDDGVEHVSGVIAAINDAATAYNSTEPVYKLLIEYDEITMQPGETVLEQLYSSFQRCDITIVVLDGLRPNVTLEYGMILGMLRAKNENTRRVIAIQASDATILVRNYYNEPTNVPTFGSNSAQIINPTLDINKHASDLSGLFIHRYDRHQIIRTIRDWFQSYFSTQLLSLSPPRSILSTDEASSTAETPAADSGDKPAADSDDEQTKRVWELYKEQQYSKIIDEAGIINSESGLKALGLAFMKCSRPHDAISTFLRLQQLASTTAHEAHLFSANLHLGICYYIVGDDNLAAQYLKEAKNKAMDGAPKAKVDSWLTRVETRRSSRS